jgi:hypothetical protein
VAVPLDAKLLVGRKEAAARLSLSVRSVDYLMANRQLKFKRIGGRVLIAVPELERFAQIDHPERIASLGNVALYRNIVRGAAVPCKPMCHIGDNPDYFRPGASPHRRGCEPR